MLGKFTALSFAAALIALSATAAHAQSRTGYGSGSSSSPYGGSNPYGSGSSNGLGSTGSRTPAFTGSPGSPSPTDADTGSSDYDQAMKAVDSSTNQAFGPPKPDSDAEDQDQTSQDTNQSSNPYTASPTIKSPEGSAAAQPSLEAYQGQGGAQSGYAGQLGGIPTGAGVTGGGGSPMIAGNASTTLGAYNNSPYERGLGGTTPSVPNAAPAAPSYTGQ